jgi:uncharacterized protein YgbK (DUF1537 family)
VRTGHQAEVALDVRHLSPGRGYQVVAVDTDTRAVDAEFAAGRTIDATRALRDADVLIKTIDSTLRGNVGTELRAAFAASGRSAAVVAPAFPRYGRRTIDGIQLLDGIPVHLGQAGADPVTPATSSDLKELIGPPFERTTIVPVRDPQALRDALRTHEFVIADAVEDGDLEAVIRSVPDPGSVLWAGSTGLSQAFGEVMPGLATSLTSYPTAHRVAIVVGSVNPRTRDQLARVADANGARIETDWDRAGWAPPPTGLVVIASPDHVIAELSPAAATAISRRLAAAAKTCVEQGVDALVLSGGDTAVAAIRALGAIRLTVAREIEPGIALAVMDGPHPLPIVTKAGGFGSPAALTLAIDALTGAR